MPLLKFYLAKPLGTRPTRKVHLRYKTAIGTNSLYPAVQLLAKQRNRADHEAFKTNKKPRLLSLPT